MWSTDNVQTQINVQKQAKKKLLETGSGHILTRTCCVLSTCHTYHQIWLAISFSTVQYKKVNSYWTQLTIYTEHPFEDNRVLQSSVSVCDFYDISDSKLHCEILRMLVPNANWLMATCFSTVQYRKVHGYWTQITIYIEHLLKTLKCFTEQCFCLWLLQR